MTNRKELLREFLLMNLGTLLVSVGVYFFKFPNHFSMGGVSGLAVLLGKLLPQLSPSTFNTIINVLFLVLGFVMLNRGFGARTVYCSILSAGLIQLFEWAFPMDRPLTDQLMLELFFAVILPALGSAILFNIDASSGGTDIAAMILKKYTGLDVGRALLLSDVVIAAAALFVFDITAGLCSLLGLALTACGGGGAVGQTPYDPETAAQALLDSGAFSDALDTVDQDTAAALYGIDADTITGSAVYTSLSAGAEEIAVLVLTDEDAAAAALDGLEARVADQKAVLESYQPDEVSKLDSAIVEQRGNSVLLAVAADAEKARAALDGLE